MNPPPPPHPTTSGTLSLLRDRPLQSYDSSRSIDRDKFRRISEMSDPPSVLLRKSETDLRASTSRLPSRKPTVIGSSEDILEYEQVRMELL